VAIATYGDEKTHHALVKDLRKLGVSETIYRIEELSLADRQSVNIIFGWRIPQDVLDSTPKLEWIQSAGAGVDWLLSTTFPKTVMVTRIVDQFGPDMGEYALLTTLAWVKNWPRLRESQRLHQWDPFLVGQLATQKVGVLGAGSIGRHVAEMFRPLVLEVRAMGRRVPQIAGVRGFGIENWREFYRGLNVLVIVLPHTPDTYHLVGMEQLLLMSPASYCINVGRGAVLDEKALVGAIQSGQLSGAALDVFETEPVPEDAILWDLPGLTMTPHISGPSRWEKMAIVFAENLSRFRRGDTLLGVVDRERGY